jgi:hypothetical protein
MKLKYEQNPIKISRVSSSSSRGEKIRWGFAKMQCSFKTNSQTNTHTQAHAHTHTHTGTHTHTHTHMQIIDKTISKWSRTILQNSVMNL